MENTYLIKVKFDNYEDMFYEFDYRPLNKRDISDEVNTFIMSQVEDLSNLKNLNVILEIYIPNSRYCEKTELQTLQGIKNYYTSKIEFTDNISKIGLRRLGYYFLIFIIFFILWYISQKVNGDKLMTTMFDTTATVILWQAITLIFIERKNHNLNKKVNQLFLEMNIKFKYID